MTHYRPSNIKILELIQYHWIKIQTLGVQTLKSHIQFLKKWNLLCLETWIIYREMNFYFNPKQLQLKTISIISVNLICK